MFAWMHKLIVISGAGVRQGIDVRIDHKCYALQYIQLLVPRCGIARRLVL